MQQNTKENNIPENTSQNDSSISSYVKTNVEKNGDGNKNDIKVIPENPKKTSQEKEKIKEKEKPYGNQNLLPYKLEKPEEKPEGREGESTKVSKAEKNSSANEQLPQIKQSKLQNNNSINNNINQNNNQNINQNINQNLIENDQKNVVGNEKKQNASKVQSIIQNNEENNHINQSIKNSINNQNNQNNQIGNSINKNFNNQNNQVIINENISQNVNNNTNNTNSIKNSQYNNNNNAINNSINKNSINQANINNMNQNNTNNNKNSITNSIRNNDNNHSINANMSQNSNNINNNINNNNSLNSQNNQNQNNNYNNSNIHKSNYLNSNNNNNNSNNYPNNNNNINYNNSNNYQNNNNYNNNNNSHNNNYNQNYNNIQTEMIFNQNSNSNDSIIEKTGLIDLGDTSYLNAVLQFLGNINILAKYFLKKEIQNMICRDIKAKPLSFVIQRLLLHLYPENKNDYKKTYKPDALLRLLGHLNIVYKSIKRRNPNDLTNFILDTLHKELNQVSTPYFNEKSNLNMNDKDMVIQNEISKYKNSNSSVISDNFNWFEAKELKCKVCNKFMFNLNVFNTFELDILRCFQKKKTPPITLNDCIKYCRGEKEQKLFCNNECKTYTTMSISSDIYNIQNIIILSLDRGNLDNAELLNIQFNLEEKIRSSSFITNSSGTQKDKEYELIGIVSVTKKDNKYVYVAFCKSNENKQWYLFDNEIITKVSSEKVLTDHNSNNYIPCLIAYQARETQ